MLGEYFWGGAASTAFFVSPVDDLIVIFLTQLRPSAGHEKVVLMGHSWGAALALQYAGAHLDHLSRLVLVSSTDLRGELRALPDRHASCRQIAVPTLLVHGAEDLRPPAVTDSLLRAFLS